MNVDLELIQELQKRTVGPLLHHPADKRSSSCRNWAARRSARPCHSEPGWKGTQRLLLSQHTAAAYQPPPSTSLHLRHRRTASATSACWPMWTMARPRCRTTSSHPTASSTRAWRARCGRVLAGTEASQGALFLLAGIAPPTCSAAPCCPTDPPSPCLAHSFPTAGALHGQQG